LSLETTKLSKKWTAFWFVFGICLLLSGLI